MAYSVKPEFTLAELGYGFNSHGELRSVKDQLPYKFTTQEEYDKLGEAVTHEVYDLMVKVGLRRHLLKKPTDTEPDDWYSFVFASPDFDRKDTLLILIHGSGDVRAGQWARKLIINENLERGTQLPYIERALRNEWGVLVMNCNDNKRIEDGYTYTCQYSGNSEMHARNVWHRFVKDSSAKNIMVVAHCRGGSDISFIMDYFAEERVSLICLTDSCFSFSSKRPPPIVVNWAARPKSSLNRPSERDLHPPRQVIQLWAGTNEKDRSSYAAMEGVFHMLESGVNRETLSDILVETWDVLDESTSADQASSSESTEDIGADDQCEELQIAYSSDYDLESEGTNHKPFYISPPNKRPQLKEQTTSDQLSAGSSAQLSFAASHVTANCENKTALHSSPAKTERGQFQFTVGNISDLGTLVTYSPFYVIGNLPWRVGLNSECSKRTGDKKFLSVYIDCNSECASTIWSCDADVKFTLLSSDSKQQSFVRNCTLKHTYNEPSWGVTFIEWSQLMDILNEYVNIDDATIEVEVTVKKVIGFRGFSKYDFDSVNAPSSLSDVVLVIEGKRIRVCKYYLAIHSPVFHAMFFSEFSDRDKKEIDLKEVEMDEFLEMLHVIYPTHKPVTEGNVDFLLKLGDQFEVQFVIDECERFLITTTKVSTPKKLVYSGQYRLAKLQDVCLKTINGSKEVIAMKLQPEYKKFTSETKVALLERLLKVS